MPPSQPLSWPAPSYTIEQFAALNQVHPRTVLRAIHEGRIPSYRIGRKHHIPASALDDLQNRSDTIDSIIDRIVAEAPPLTEEQRTRIAGLLRTSKRAKSDDA